MKRPTIKSPCAADNYHGPGERIAEVRFPDGSCCLLSIKQFGDVKTIEPYRADAGICVYVDGHHIEVPTCE